MAVPPYASGTQIPKEAGVDQRAHRLGRIALGLVVLGGVRRDAVARDLSGQIADHRWSSVR